MGMKLIPFLVFAMLLAPSAFAQQATSYVPPTCDASLYKAIKTKATLEGQREQMLNSNLLFKPDSVLEYSCFNAALGTDLAPKATDFSDPKKAPHSMGAVVVTPAQEYTKNNFSHAVLGGHGTDPQKVASGYSTCSIMNNVWRQAKCGNFQQEPRQTAFADFAEYADGQNKRTLPEECQSVEPLPWKEALQVVYPPGNVDTNTAYEKLNSESCAATAVISTGVPLKYKSTQSLNGLTEGKICAAPGCYYNIGAKACN